MDGSLAESGAGPIGLDTSEAEGYITVETRNKRPLDLKSQEDHSICHNSKQAQQLREATRFCDVEVKVTEGSPLNATSGVITGVDLDITRPKLNV